MCPPDRGPLKGPRSEGHFGHPRLPAPPAPARPLPTAAGKGSAGGWSWENPRSPCVRRPYVCTEDQNKLPNPAFATIVALQVLRAQYEAGSLKETHCDKSAFQEMSDVWQHGLQVTWQAVPSFLRWLVMAESAEVRASEVRLRPHVVDAALNLSTLIEKFGATEGVNEYKCYFKGQLGLRRVNDAIWLLKSPCRPPPHVPGLGPVQGHCNGRRGWSAGGVCLWGCSSVWVCAACMSASVSG